MPQNAQVVHRVSKFYYFELISVAKRSDSMSLTYFIEVYSDIPLTNFVNTDFEPNWHHTIAVLFSKC